MDPIVDSHVHLWDPRYLPVDWLEQIPLLNAPYGLTEYAAATEGVPVAAFVYVQVEADPAYGLVEARWAAARACEDPRLGAIVAWAPVERGARLRAYLDSLVAVSTRITGVRRLFQTEPGAAFVTDGAVVDGVRLLGDYGLVFDLGVCRDQLPAAAMLARRCPQTRFVLDHLAFPEIAGRELDPWRRDLHALAQLPNVACKLSGLATVAGNEGWITEDLAPYVLHALAVFGPERVMFGSDWPVLLQASTYARWLEALQCLLSDLPEREQRRVWAENARTWYRIDSPPPALADCDQEPKA